MSSTKSTLYSGPRADMLHQGAGKWISPGQRDLFQHAPIMGYTSWASSTEKGRKAMTGRPFARRKQLSDDSDDEEDDEDDSFDAEWGRETSEAVEKRISIRPAMTTPSFGSNKPVHPTYTRKGPPPVRTLPTPPISASSSTTDGRSPDVHNAISNPWSRGSSKTHPSFSSAELDADRQRTPSFPTSPRAIRPRTTSDTASQGRLGSPSKKLRGPRWHARTAVMARQEAVKALETPSRSGWVQAPSAIDARGEDISSSNEAGGEVADIGKARTLPATPPADTDPADPAETSRLARDEAAQGSVASVVATRESPARARSPMDVDDGAMSGSEKEEAAGQGMSGTRMSSVMVPPDRSRRSEPVTQASEERDQVATEGTTTTARVAVQRAVSPIEVDGEGTDRAGDEESIMEAPCAAPLTASADAPGRSQLPREAGERYRRFPDPFAALPSGSTGSTDQPTPPAPSNPPDRPLSAVGQSPSRSKTCLDIYNEKQRAYQTSGRTQQPSDTTTARFSHQQREGASHHVPSRLAGDSTAIRPLHYSFDDEGYRSPARDSDTDEDEPQSDVDVLDRPSVRQAAQPIRASTPAGHRSTTPRRTVPNPINAVPSPSNNNVRQAQGRVSAGTPRPVSAGPLPSGAGPGRSNPIIVVDSDNDDDDVEVQAIDSAVFNRSIRRSDAGGMTSSRGDRAATARRTSTSHSADQPVRAISGVAATRPLGSTSGPSGDIDRANVEVLVIPSSDPPEIDVEVEALADRPVKDNKTTRGRKVGGASGPDSAAGKSGDTAPVRKRVSESANRKRDARSVTFHRSASVASDTSDLQVRPDTPTKSVVAAATRSSGKARSVREGNQNHGLDTPHLGEAAAGMPVLENAVPLRATSRADGAPAPVVSIPVSTPIAKARTPPTLTRLARAIVPSSTEAGPSTRRIIADPDTSLPGPSNGGTAVAGHKADLSSRRAGLHPQMEGRRDGKFTTWSTRVIPGTAADLFPQLDKIYDGGKDRRLMKLHQETTWQVYGWTEQKRFFQICWNRMVRERNLTSEKKTVQARTAYFRRFIERYGELMRRAGVTHEFIDHLEFLKKHKHIANSTFATINELWEGDDAETA